jgi:hypothetical protein
VSVTLRARVDVALADQVKRYAAAHRQPLSVVIRDALILLMEEYPAGTNPTVPQRLAAHEFLSDRYESPLDLLVGETDTAELEAFLAETHAGVIDTILADTTGAPALMSDTKDTRAARASARKAERVEPRPGRPARARSRKASGRKTAISDVSQRQRGRQSNSLPQRILMLLAAHPEGLSAQALRVALNTETRLGETLQRLRHAGVVTTRGHGKALRYAITSP